MNKQLIRGLPNGAGIEFLAGFRPISNALIITDGAAVISGSPQDFFDLIVCHGYEALRTNPQPDVYVHDGDRIDLGGAAWLPSAIGSLQNVLVVVSKQTRKKLQALGGRPKNYIIECVTGDLQAARLVVSSLGADPEKIWVLDKNGLSNKGCISSQEDFFCRVDKYGAPKNIKSRNRKMLMEI
mgnify:CR=1 FL=1